MGKSKSSRGKIYNGDKRAIMAIVETVPALCGQIVTAVNADDKDVALAFLSVIQKRVAEMQAFFAEPKQLAKQILEKTAAREESLKSPAKAEAIKDCFGGDSL